MSRMTTNAIVEKVAAPPMAALSISLSPDGTFSDTELGLDMLANPLRVTETKPPEKIKKPASVPLSAEPSSVKSSGRKKKSSGPASLQLLKQSNQGIQLTLQQTFQKPIHTATIATNATNATNSSNGNASNGNPRPSPPTQPTTSQPKPTQSFQSAQSAQATQPPRPDQVQRLPNPTPAASGTFVAPAASGTFVAPAAPGAKKEEKEDTDSEDSSDESSEASDSSDSSETSDETDSSDSSDSDKSKSNKSEKSSKTRNGNGGSGNKPGVTDARTLLTPQQEELEKRKLLFALYRYQAKNNVQLPEPMGIHSSLEDIRTAVDFCRRETRMDSAVKMSKQVLVTICAGLEFLNEKFDPFDIYLTGWSETVKENEDEYNEVLGELYEKYQDKVEVSPEMKLVMMVAGGAFSYHLINKGTMQVGKMISGSDKEEEKKTTTSSGYGVIGDMIGGSILASKPRGSAESYAKGEELTRQVQSNPSMFMSTQNPMMSTQNPIMSTQNPIMSTPLPATASVNPMARQQLPPELSAMMNTMPSATNTRQMAPDFRNKAPQPPSQPMPAPAQQARSRPPQQAQPQQPQPPVKRMPPPPEQDLALLVPPMEIDQLLGQVMDKGKKQPKRVIKL